MRYFAKQSRVRLSIACAVSRLRQASSRRRGILNQAGGISARQNTAHVLGQSVNMKGVMMKDRFGPAATSQRAAGFQPLTADEMQFVEGGLSWSGIWGAIKDAANWVKDHIFVDFGNRLLGYKGVF